MQHEIKPISLIVFIALASTPVVGIYSGFAVQQQSTHVDDGLPINNTVSLQRARTCVAAVATGGDVMLPTLFGGVWEGDASQEGQYLCARDGSTAAVHAGQLVRLATVSTNKLDAYQSILKLRGLIPDDNSTVSEQP